MKMNLNLIEAINLALDTALQEDKSVMLLGEDIGKMGGVFGASKNLQKKYGKNRVMDTPLAESSLAGIAVGMSAMGLRPVLEYQFMGFSYAGLEQVISHASRMRKRSQGKKICPIVFRMPYGGGIKAPEHHSESTEALFAHIPGINVVIPSSPNRAFNLLQASIKNDDPLVFLEPTKIYRGLRENIKYDPSISLNKAYVKKQGDRLTIIAWGSMFHFVESFLNEQDIGIELIDLSTISPIDEKTIIQSVKKTGRCIIVQEAAKTCSIASEISAILAEKCIEYLQAPIQRVTGFDTIMPPAEYESQYMPSHERIKQAIDKVI
jgi:2-oxoisovalerate dehydrogenase E1 component beta subunit